MVSNEQSGGISMLLAGWVEEGGVQGWECVGRGGGMDFHSNSQVPSCHVWAEIGAVSTGTT